MALALLSIASFALATRGEHEHDLAAYAGEWKLDRSRSDGIPADMERTMTITRSGVALDVREQISSKEDSQTLTDQFPVDGRQHEFVPQGPNGLKGRGRRTVAWASEGGFTVDEQVSFVVPDPASPDGAGTKEMHGSSTRRWSLSADGQELTVESTIEGPRGAVSTVRVYVKAKKGA